MKGTRYGTVEAVQAEAMRALKEIPEEDFQDSFRKWKKRWKKCVKVGVEYFEGDHIVTSEWSKITSLKKLIRDVYCQTSYDTQGSIKPTKTTTNQTTDHVFIQNICNSTTHLVHDWQENLARHDLTSKRTEGIRHWSHIHKIQTRKKYWYTTNWEIFHKHIICLLPLRSELSDEVANSISVEFSANASDKKWLFVSSMTFSSTLATLLFSLLSLSRRFGSYTLWMVKMVGVTVSLLNSSSLACSLLFFCVWLLPWVSKYAGLLRRLNCICVRILCSFICRIKNLLALKQLPHWSHVNGRLSEWVTFLWYENRDELLNVFGHRSHWNGLSPVCVRIWLISDRRTLNFFGHIEQGWA